MTRPPHQPDNRDYEGDDDNDDAITAQDYDIGYCKPPKVTRFKKGVSGNPSGSSRARRASRSQREALPFTDVILEEMRRPVTITDNGVRTEIETQRAIVRSASVNAMKGGLNAQKAVMDWHRDAQASQRAERENRFDLLARYVTDQKNLEAHPLPGRQPNWPRWQDVHLDYPLGIGEVFGPIDEEQAASCEALLDRYAYCASHRAALADLCERASAVNAFLLQDTINVIDRLLDIMAHHLPPSSRMRLGDNAVLSTNAHLTIEIDGQPIALARLIDEDMALTPDMLATILHSLNTKLTELAQKAMKQAKLSVRDNTESLLRRLRQKEQDRSDGHAVPDRILSFSDMYGPREGDDSGIHFLIDR